MTTYLLYISSPILIAFFTKLLTNKSVNQNHKIRQIYILLCGFTIAFMVGFRHYSNGSTDSLYYYENWDIMSSLSFSRLPFFLENIDMEKGYLFSVWFFSHIFNEPQFLFILSGIFFAFSVSYFIDKNCDNVVLGFLIFNCLGLFNFMVQGLRQAIAMCICLFAIEKCKKNQFISFSILVFLASLFHASAYAFFIMYLISKLKINIKGITLFVCAAIASLISLDYIFDIMNNFIADEYSIGSTLNDGSGYITILINLSVILAGLLLYNSKKSDSTYNIFFYMCCVTLTTLILRNTVNNIAERISHYFSFGIMILIPACIKNIDDDKVKLFVNILIAMLLMAVAFHKATYSSLIPYKFFWQ